MWRRNGGAVGDIRSSDDDDFFYVEDVFFSLLFLYLLLCLYIRARVGRHWVLRIYSAIST